MLIALGTATAVSCAATPVARWLALRHGTLDLPDERKVHTAPIPTSGGLAIIVGFLAAAAAVAARVTAHVEPRQLAVIVIGGLMVAAMGLVDDRLDLPAKLKLVLQTVATVPLLVGGVTVSFVSNPLPPGGMIALPGWLSWVVTAAWVVAVTNAMNLIDGLDGLAAGVSTIACLALAVIALNMDRPAVALLCAALAGGTLGYLPWNWHPARIIMGDTGAYFLGYVIAAITIIGPLKMAGAIAIFVPVLVLAVPLFDTVLSPVRRYLRGRPAFRPDRDHLHHRLLAMGLSEQRVVLLIYVVTAVCGAVAIWISRKA